MNDSGQPTRTTGTCSSRSFSVYITADPNPPAST